MVNVMEQLKTVKLAPKCERRINRGYLWIFSNEITDNLKNYVPGDLVRIVRHDGKILGTGYINPHSLIAIRILAYEQRIPDHEFFLEKIRSLLSMPQQLCLLYK